MGHAALQHLPAGMQRSSFTRLDLPASLWGPKSGLGPPEGSSLPLSEPVVVIDAVDEQQTMMASPAIIKLQSGRLLEVHEVVPRHTVSDSSVWKRVRAFAFLHLFDPEVSFSTCSLDT